MKYNLVNNDGFSNITVFTDGELLAADSNHPNFKNILAGVLNDDESVVDLFDVTKQLAVKFERLSERVSVNNGRVFFDGDEVNNELTRQILRFLEEDVKDWNSLIDFWEKLSTNPNEHSREQLYRWLRDRDFTITGNGDLIAYKGVRRGEGGVFYSINAGKALVNGEVKEGYIPQALGSIVTMPRSEVQFDSSVGCSTGLHAGTWEYASAWAPNTDGAVLKVLINPRDVVSVPTDCNDQKLRVCKYTIAEIVDKPQVEVVDHGWDADYSTWDDEEDYYDDDDDDDYYTSDGYGAAHYA